MTYKFKGGPELLWAVLVATITYLAAELTARGGLPVGDELQPFALALIAGAARAALAAGVAWWTAQQQEPTEPETIRIGDNTSPINDNKDKGHVFVRRGAGYTLWFDGESMNVIVANAPKGGPPVPVQVTPDDYHHARYVWALHHPAEPHLVEHEQQRQRGDR